MTRISRICADRILTSHVVTQVQSGVRMFCSRLKNLIPAFTGMMAKPFRTYPEIIFIIRIYPSNQI